MRENPLLASEKQKNKFGLTESACAKGLVRMSSCFRALPLVELMLIILLRSRADLQGKLYGDVFAQTCLISFKESSWIRLCHEKYYRKKVKTNKTTAFLSAWDRWSWPALLPEIRFSGLQWHVPAWKGLVKKLGRA